MTNPKNWMGRGRIPALVVSMLAIGLAVPVAQAQKIRARKTAGYKIKAKKVASGKARDQRKTGPTRIDFQREKARKIALARNEALQSLKRQRMVKLIDRLLQSRTYRLRRFRSKRSATLMRKASLQFEEARYQNLLRYERHEKAMAAFYKNPKPGQKEPKSPKPVYDQPIKTFQALLKEDPGFRRGDEVRFRLGYCLHQIGLTKAAIRALADLVQKNPRSIYAVDAYLQMGEIWFAANRFIAAMGNYQMVMKAKPNSAMAGYAEYKYAWSLYHQNKHAGAVKAMRSVVKNRGAQLRGQALNDLIVFFAELPNGWQKARAYFKAQGGRKLQLKQMWKMGRYLDGQDKTAAALQVIAWLVSANGSAPLTTAYHQLQIDILVRMNNVPKLDAGLQRVVAFYEPKGAWARANRARKSTLKEGFDLGEKAMAFLATYYHRQGKKSGNAELMRRAVARYETFLARFPGSAQYGSMSFFLAEILRSLNEWDKAAKRYAQVVARGESKLRQDAAFQRVYCLAQILKGRGLDKPVKRIPGRALEVPPRTPLKPIEKRFVSACDEFARLYPKSKDTPAVLFKAARIYFDHGRLRLAGRRFGRVVLDHPKVKYAALSGAMALDNYSRLRDWPEVVRWARHLIKIRNFQHYKRRQLREIIAASGIKAAGILEKRGKFVRAAESMLAVYEEFPKDKAAPRALFNAAGLLSRAKKLDRAIGHYETVRKKFKKTSFAAKATFILGRVFEARAEFDKAARYYAFLGRMSPIKSTPDALYNASVMREALGQYRQAEVIRRRYVKLYPNRKGATKALFDIGKLLERQKKWGAAEKHYLKFLKDKVRTQKRPSLVVAAWTRAGLAVRKGKRGKVKRAIKYFTNAGRAFRKLRLQAGGIAAAYAGWARFLLGEVHFDEFEAVKLKGKVRQVAKLLGKKAKLLEKAKRVYQSVLPYKARVWSTAAVYRIGMLYARTVESIYAIPVPRSIRSADDKEKYKADLQQLAQPVEDAAIRAFRTAVSVGHRLRIYNKWTVASARRMIKYEPDRYPDAGRPVVKGSQTGDPDVARPAWGLR